jgi:hypothetical protein
MLSMGNTRSVTSTSSSTRKSGVAIRFPFSTVQNFCPSYRALMGSQRRAVFTTTLFSRSAASSLRTAILMPVSSRMPPKTWD